MKLEIDGVIVETDQLPRLLSCGFGFVDLEKHTLFVNSDYVIWEESRPPDFTAFAIYKSWHFSGDALPELTEGFRWIQMANREVYEIWKIVAQGH